MKKCRACEHRTTEILDFGRVALAGAFLKADGFAEEKKYPLTLRFCEKCLLVQVGEVVPAATMFENYFYHSSATETMRRHFEQLARSLVAKFAPSSVLEIGCNDGILLRPLQKLGITRLLGVDPAKNLTPGDLPILTGYWGTEFARAALFGDRFDLIVASNVFAHIADINDVCEAVAMALEPPGTFVFEVNRLDELVSGVQYDWVYHEHLHYYSLLALEGLLARHGLEVYDLHKINTHAGSMRYFAGHKGAHPVTRQVSEHRVHEMWMRLDRADRFDTFAQGARDHREEFRTLVGAGGKVVGYGACGRTNTMLQFCGLDSKDIAYIVDDAPAKHGFYTPGTHIQISAGKRLAHEPPCTIIVFAWSFLSEIAPKLGDYPGRVFVPLPHIYEHRMRQAA